MKIQLDIPMDINKKLKIERVIREHSSMRETIIEILEEYFNAK